MDKVGLVGVADNPSGALHHLPVGGRLIVSSVLGRGVEGAAPYEVDV